MRLGCMISLGGAVTWANARRSVEVAAKLPLDALLVETDSPFGAPEPLRGQRNTPEALPYIVERIAEIRGTSYDDIRTATRMNALRFFGLEDREER